MRAGGRFLLLCLALPACAPAIELPETCEEAFTTVQAGQRGPTLDRAGGVEVGESLPVYRYGSNRSLAMTYGRSVALGCLLLEEQPRPNALLRGAIDDGLSGRSGSAAAFDANPAALIVVDGSNPIVSFDVSDPNRLSEIDFDSLEPGMHDDGIGIDDAEQRAQLALAKIIDAGLIDDRDLELVASSSTKASGGGSSWTTQFQFVFGYVPGGIRAFGPRVEIRIDREGPVLGLAMAEADITFETSMNVVLDEAQADALLEAYEPAVQTAYEGVGPAWFSPTALTGESQVQSLRYYGEVSRGVRWISMMDPEAEVAQTP